MNDMRLGSGELYVHDDTDLAGYERFFEFYLSNGEMAGRIDALHSQHVRGGAKKDVLCVRLVDIWGERTYPVHRGRPGGRFISILENGAGDEVSVGDVSGYRQELDPKTAVLETSYSWRRSGGAGANESRGFMSKVRKHLMAQRYVDTVQSTAHASANGADPARNGCWRRSFTVETLFPYHSRATAFYFKKPYNAKRWAWGEVEHENEVEPTKNASAAYDPEEDLGVITFSTDCAATGFPELQTAVVWAVKPATPPDGWETDEKRGSLTLRWDLSPGEKRDTTVFSVVMTDRDGPGFVERARREVGEAWEAGWAALEEEHVGWWSRELARSRVTLPDPTLQKLYDVSMTAMLANVGGSYWGFIGVDNVIYETCMCDNTVMLHSLVETNHLAEARGELELLNRYLPTARKNAADRMKIVLGVESDEAALLPFYMTEDGIELWQDNVFGMYTSMSAFHFLLLSKTASYLGDREFLRATVYPWSRAYAEYGRLNAEWSDRFGAYIFPVQNMGGGGEGYWYRVTMNERIYKRMFTRPDAPFRFCDFPPLEYIPVEELSRLDDNWIDVVANFRWILDRTAALAERLGVDAERRRQWREVGAKVLFPQDERRYLSHIGENARPGLGGPAVGGLFWPAEGTFETLDPKKLRRTFDEIAGGRLMRGIAEHRGRSWDAVNGFQYAYMGRGEDALQFLKSFGLASDPRGIEMRESIDRRNYYYLLNHGTLILLTRCMLLQTYGGRIRLFPAVPAEWREGGVEFAGMPAEGGLLVSGRTRAGPRSRIESEAAITDREGAPLLSCRGAFESLEVVPHDLTGKGGAVCLDLKGVHAPVEVTVPGLHAGRTYRVQVDEREWKATADPELKLTVQPPAVVRVAALE